MNKQIEKKKKIQPHTKKKGVAHQTARLMQILNYFFFTNLFFRY